MRTTCYAHVAAATALLYTGFVSANDARADGTFSIVCDQAFNGELTTFTARDTLKFAASSGERVYISIKEVEGTPGFVPIWQLRDPFNAPVGAASSGREDRGPLPSTGEYRIEVRDNDSNAQGQYQIHMQRLTAAFACEGIALPCDVTITHSVAGTLDSDLLSFSAADGERFWVTVVEESGVGFDVMWRLLDASGAQSTAFTANNRVDLGPLSSANSPYRLQIAENGGNATGTYLVNFQRLTDGSECDVVALPCDSTLTDSVDSEIDSDLFRFSVSDGERFFLSVMEESGAGFDVMWRLLDATGNQAAGGFTANNRVDLGPLSAANSPYRLQVAENGGNAVGTYNINLQRLTADVECEIHHLPCDTTYTSSIATALDTDLLEFEVSEGERLYMTVLEHSGSGFDVMWRVLDATGSQAAGGFTASNRVDLGPLSSTGNPYRLQVAENGGNATGTYGVHLQRLTAGLECDAASLPCDTIMTGAVETTIENDLWSFSATEGERFYVSVAEESGTPGFDAIWRVLDAAGVQVVGWDAAIRADRGPLTAAGSPYRIQVAENSATATGTYSIHLQRLTAAFACESIVLPSDTALIESIDTIIDSDLFQIVFPPTFPDSFFSVPISVASVTATAIDPVWRLLDASGTGVSNCAGFSSSPRTCGPLGGNTPYIVQVLGNSATQVGSYRISSGMYGATSLPDEVGTLIPLSFALDQNSPNPFGGRTTIRFALPREGHVRLRVFDVNGREIATLVNEEVGVGMHEVDWEGSDVASGVYFYRLETPGFASTRKLLVVK
jgi:hypothetical protein